MNRERDKWGKRRGSISYPKGHRSRQGAALMALAALQHSMRRCVEQLQWCLRWKYQKFPPYIPSDLKCGNGKKSLLCSRLGHTFPKPVDPLLCYTWGPPEHWYGQQEHSWQTSVYMAARGQLVVSTGPIWATSEKGVLRSSCAASSENLARPATLSLWRQTRTGLAPCWVEGGGGTRYRGASSPGGSLKYLLGLAASSRTP